MKKLLQVVLFFLLTGSIQANSRLSFRTFDVNSGISDNYVQAILRDHYGFMWFAAINGLNRYDGYQFKRYNIMQLGAYNNNIKSIAEDASGIIWIQAPSEYYFYNRESDEIDNRIHTILSQWGIHGNIKALFVDYNRDLWCIADEILYYYTFTSQKLQQLTLPSDKKVLQLVSRQMRPYLLFANGEIAHINWKESILQVETQTALPASEEHRMYIDTQLRLWVYTVYEPGIRCYDTTTKSWIHFPKEDILKNKFITSLIDDGSGNIWIGTNNEGIYITNTQDNNCTLLDRKADDRFSLPSNHIGCFYKDNQDIMWVGTTKQGVTFTCLNNTSFDIHRTPELEDVNCLREDQNGSLWLGFDGKGLACYKQGQPGCRIFNTQNSTIPSDLIVCSFLDSQNRMWFGSFGGGAFYEKKGQFIPVNYSIGNNQEGHINHVRCITEDNQGNMWFGSIRNGVFCMSKDGKFDSYTMGASGLLTNSITDLLYTTDHNILYIGTSSGLYKMNIQTRQLVPIKGNNDGTQLLSDSYINCLYQDSRGVIWIGTRSGIYAYDVKKDTFVLLSTENGLSHPYIRAIIEDHDKNIWISTDRGITQVIVINDPIAFALQYRCYPYYEEDGIGHMIFNNHSIYCSKQGEILMGSSGKYLKINPKIKNYHSNNHKVIFTGLYLANQRMDVGFVAPDGRILLHKNIQLTDKIVMDYSDHNFALEVSAMDYAIQHKLQFAYRLEGNEDWVKLEGNRIYFNKLSPGVYRLQVKVNENYIATPLVSELTIQVNPPYWLSTSAYIIYTLLLALCLYLILKGIRRKHHRILKEQKREMEMLQQHEMSEAKMRFFTNVSHDLRTPLSLIIIPLERLLQAEKAKLFKDELSLIHRNATTLMNEVNLLLDFRKLDQQKTQLTPSHGNLSDFIKETYATFSTLFQKSGITMHLQINSPVIEMDFDSNKMQRIILNLLSNAVKYSHENGTITITIDRVLATNGEQARISVVDTGIGIKDENKEKIFDRFFQEHNATSRSAGSGIGLHIVKEYVLLHNGQITVEDNQPKGSIFTITLPITRLFKLALLPNEGEQEEKVENTEQKVPEADNATATLLIVEDNNDFRHFLIDCLKEHYRVLEASDGKKALSILSRQSVSIVISDVMMPVMDGMELCQKIKTDIRYSHIPVILLTARTAEEQILSGLREGADDYITKPFNLEILLLRIRKILMWTQSNHYKFKTIDISPAEITVSTLDEQLIERAIRIMEDQMDNSDFSVEELSIHVGMSRSGLYKKLMMITGKSPLEFMRILRLKRGRQLLEQSQLSISQIAYQVGLSPKQFAKYFKEEFGHLPSDYLKRVKE